MISPNSTKAYRVPQCDITNEKFSKDVSNIHWTSTIDKLNNGKRPLEIAQGLNVLKEVRKKQIIQGVIKRSVGIKTKMLVVPELWPSSLLGYVLPTKESSVWVVCKNCPEVVKEVLPICINWVDQLEAATLVREQKCNWISIQGSLEFVEEILNTWGNLSLEGSIKLQVILPAKRYRGFKSFLKHVKCWKNVSHSLLGGVSSARWKLGIWGKESYWKAVDLHGICQAYGLVRRFSDILSHTEGGVVAEKSMKPLPELLSWTPDGFRTKFVIPSVFSRTQFVFRRLILKELGAVFDLPENIIISFQDKGIHTLNEFLQLFQVDILPMKLSQLLHNVVAATPEDLVSLKGPCEETASKLAEVEDKALLTYPQALGNSGGIMDCFDVDQYLKAYGQKAGKDDDTEVPVMLWNNYMFTHGWLKNVPYTFSHGVAINELRCKWAFPRYKKFVRRSFLKYMQLEYGDLWMERFHATRAAKLSRKRKRQGDKISFELLSDSIFKELIEIGQWEEMELRELVIRHGGNG